MAKKRYKSSLYIHPYDGGGWMQAAAQWLKDNPEVLQMAQEYTSSQAKGGNGGGSQQPADRGVTGQKTVWQGDNLPLVGGISSGMADLANAINALSDKGNEPVEKVMGLPGNYYSCGGNVHKFDGGGMSGAMDWMGVASTGLDLASNAVKTAKGVDTKAYEEKVKNFGNTEVKASSNDELLNLWGNRNYLNKVNKYDITGGNLAGDIIGGINSNIGDSLKGGMAGLSVGGVPGAIVGTVIGGVGNLVGQIFGAVNTAKKVKALNKSIDRANKRQDRAFDDAATNLKKKQVANMMYNYAAYGGPIYNMPYMSAGATGYDIAKDNAYAKQMQIQTKNSTSFNPIFNSSGYEFADGGGIHIAPSKRGTFTAAAKKHGKSVQAFASQVLANKENYSPAMVKKANFARNAAKWHADGGSLLSEDFTNGVTTINQGGTHENNPHEGVQMGIAPDGAPNLVEEGEAIYKDYVFSNRLRVPKEVRNKYKLRGPKDMTFAEAFIAAQKESEERPNDPISEDSLENIAMILARTQEAVRGYKEAHKKAKGGHLFGGDINPYPAGSQEWFDWEQSHQDTQIINNAPKGSYEGTFGTTNPVVPTPPVTKTQNSNKDKKKTGDTSTSNLGWLRFAEPLANLGVVASDMFGGTNTPTQFDYIPSFTPVGFTPLGNYIPVTHFDTRYAANQAAQQAAATRAALMQSSGPSKWANILAADYNAQIALGDLLRQGALQDYQMMLDREQFNRGTNQMNSEMGLKAEMTNQEQRLKYAQAALQQAKMNEDNSNKASAARAANLSALAESTANIGREADAKSWRDMLLEDDVYGTQTVANLRAAGWNDTKIRNYYKKKGLSDDDITALGIKACGGRMKKRKKGLTY